MTKFITVNVSIITASIQSINQFLFETSSFILRLHFQGLFSWT